MPASFVPKTVLIDTGFWFAIYDATDQYHIEAVAIYQNIQNSRLLIPWPTLYEFANTRFFKNPLAISGFERLLKKQNVERLDDSKYRDLALEQSFYSSNRQWRISLVDSVIREILSDVNVSIDYFVTFNQKDFMNIIKRRKTTQFYYL